MDRSSRSPRLGALSSLDPLTSAVVSDDPWRSASSHADRSGGGVAQPMPLAVYTTDTQAVIVAALPGMQPEDLELTVHRDTVTLRGTIRDVVDAEDAQGATWYVHELGSGAYQRSVTLPFAVDADRADATLEHGLLRVVLPKVEAVRPHKVRIGGRGE